MIKFILIAGALLLLWMWWRAQAKTPRVSLDEARLLLGVDDSATPDDIRAAHRRIIARVHPDAGGSTELARRINAARDLLLKSSVTPPPAP